MARKKILFVFDRVLHYHRDLFRELEAALVRVDVELMLLSGIVDTDQSGRVGLRARVIENEHKFRFREYRIRNFTIRRHVGVLEFIRDHRPDVVVVQGHVGNWTYWRMQKLKRTLGFRLVSWQCGYEYNPGRLKDLVLKRFVPHFDHHLAYHTNARDYAIAHGAMPDQVTVFHNTINEARIVRLDRAEARRRIVTQHPGLEGNRIVLYVGAILAEKRLELVLDALARMQRPDMAFLVVGDGPHLSALAARCDGRRDVVLAGPVFEGVGHYFDAADVFVLPGTGGLAINEAMAHGLPVISGYADGSADDLVSDGVNGYRLHDGSAQEIADRIEAIIDDPVRAAEMGRCSLERINGTFSFQRLVERVAGVLARA